MTTRRPSGDPSATENEPGSADNPRSGAAASTFDAAQDLLQAALDEVRGGGGPPKPPAPNAAAAKAPAPKAQTRAPSGPREAPTSATEVAPAGTAPVPSGASAGPAGKAAEETEFWAKPTPGATQSTPSGSEATTPARRRGAAAAAAAAQPDEFDGLTDTLYQPTARGRRRRRRPATAAGTLAVAGSLAATGTEPVADVSQATRRTNPTDETAAAASATGTPEVRAVPEVETPTGTGAAPTVALVAANATTDRPSADPARAAPEEMPAAGESQNRRTPWIIAAAVAAVLAVGALAIVVPGGGGSDEAAVEAGGKARLTFAPITTAEGATVTRTWELEGRKGDEFIGTLAITNPTSAPLATTHTEVIPKAIAANVSDITFDPQPVVIKADPVVEYRLTVPAGATATVTYKATVAPDGVDRRRLDAWARELPQTTTTTTTTSPPAPATTTPPPTATTPNRPPVTNAPVRPTTPTTSPPEPPPTTNPPAATGTIGITVISHSANEQGGTFVYSTPVDAISLTTGGGDSSASWSSPVDAGTYTLTQISKPDYFFLYTVSCSNGFSGSGPSASVTVNPGEFVSCTFENRPK